MHNCVTYNKWNAFFSAWEKDFKQYEIESAKNTGKKLASEEYTTIYEYDIEGIIVAGKISHSREALKIDKKVIQQYLKECRLVSTLRHPNIVVFFGVLFDASVSPLPVMLTEKLEANLDTLICRKVDLSLGIKLSFFADVARGLQYLHSRNIVHCGLTPRRVLVDSLLVAKIGNFRGVMQIRSYHKSARMYHQHLYGHPEFMSPEFEDSISPSVDIFSLGHLIVYIIQVSECPT